MFRKIRRIKQELKETDVIDILNKERTGILSVIGDEGYPYGVPVNYVYSDNKIYFHSAKDGHKIDAIKNNPKVCFTIISKDILVSEELTTYFESVVIFGHARIIENKDEMISSMHKFAEKYNKNMSFIDSEIEKTFNQLLCIEISIDHISGKEAIELTRKREK